MISLKNKNLLLLLILIVLFTFTGCSESTNEIQADVSSDAITKAPQVLEGDHFEILRSASEEFLNNSSLETISAEEVYQKVVLEGDTGYFLVDIRSTEDFAKGSIEGAVNIPYVLTAQPNMIANLPKDKKIIVACYSGHTANQTVAFWRMLGYDAIAMFNGMGGWNSFAGSQSTKKVEFNYPVTTEVPNQTVVYELPTIKSDTATDLNSLIIERSQGYLSSGRGPNISAEEVYKNSQNYFLVDIRSNDDYNKGHILDSINLPYREITKLENLRRLPTDKKIVLIGYTGNDANQIVRILNQLGYDSYAMFQGMRVWTSDAEINGINPVSTEIVPEFPLKQLDYNLDGEESGSASCG